MYLCQSNFAIFAATSALGVSWQHLNQQNVLVRVVYRFHVQLILHKLYISLPHEDGFSKVKIIMKTVHITVSPMSMALMQMKRGCMETGFI